MADADGDDRRGAFALDRFRQLAGEAEAEDVLGAGMPSAGGAAGSAKRRQRLVRAGGLLGSVVWPLTRMSAR